MFDCYKWDPQFSDNNTIAKYALVITEEEHKELEKLTEDLDRETREAEEFLNNNQNLTKPLILSKKVEEQIGRMKNYKPEEHIRLMRYDFHPTTEEKWKVSEVNSDVPGGFAEASLMPRAAMQLLKEGNYWYRDFGECMCDAVSQKVQSKGRIMLVHCTCYSDDRQVMQFLGDRLKYKGFSVIYGAADHINFKDNKAYSILDGNEGELNAIFRFTPIEWLVDIKPQRWQGYFDTTTVSCNHPVAVIVNNTADQHISSFLFPHAKTHVLYNAIIYKMHIQSQHPKHFSLAKSFAALYNKQKTPRSVRHGKFRQSR